MIDIRSNKRKLYKAYFAQIKKSIQKVKCWQTDHNVIKLKINNIRLFIRALFTTSDPFGWSQNRVPLSRNLDIHFPGKKPGIFTQIMNISKP